MDYSKIKLTEKYNVYLKPQRNLDCSRKDKYLNNINEQFDKFKKYLPDSCDNLLSIGCGLAVPEIPFYEYYKNKNLNYFLFDKSCVDKKIHFGYQEKASFYNSLDDTKEIYINYGINEQNINLIEASNENLLSLPKMDIITSFISWGFHFPLITYLENVIKLMHKESILIIDIRTLDDNTSTSLINEYFEIINNIEEFTESKSIRYVLKLKQ